MVQGRGVTPSVAEAAKLLATVVGQDLQEDSSGRFRIARRVAPDRVISTVDTDARHGRKTSARPLDGYKGHTAVDPDSEIITATAVTAANAPDSQAAPDLIADLLNNTPTSSNTPTSNTGGSGEAAKTSIEKFPGRPTVYGDSAYGGGELQKLLTDHSINSGCRSAAPTAPKGHYTKDRFRIDLQHSTVTCPNQITVTIKTRRDGTSVASFGKACNNCELREACTDATGGRTPRMGKHEAVLTKARQRQKTRRWQHNYRATRPKIERKLAHLMRRQHSGRRARMRGNPKTAADFNLLAAAANIARLAVLGLHTTPTQWAIT